MFTLIRNIHGLTETLKDSSSQLDKNFIHISDATNLAKKLNRNTVEDLQWTVHEIIEPTV
ncbi:hypothetical protein [Alkalicoccobacillus gibsonii]|uniref:hypothetical protein n=1 Tax=Alkalicoccobacillus gibsonii TaxID=79881 RepID=UPI001933B99E|nr:hypothetical protein [Alkalicoccobacillus gibsonii]MBM0066753.1 hypothetical protein [Alkalicoccobacillus gibsonii]